MVDLKRRRFGLDINGAKMTLASRSLEAGLNVIDMIEDVSDDSLAEKLSPHDGDLYFSVGENNALIKRVGQPYDHGLNETAVARFEFASSLVDDPDKYFIDIHDGGPVTTKLAVGYDRKKVGEIISRIGRYVDSPTGFRLRSLALAQAYLHLCKPEGGRLVCLLDLGDECAAYCFIHDKTGVLPGALWFGANGSNSWDEVRGANLVDLAATVQYQLAVLARSGLTDPLSRIIVSGPKADESTLLQLEKLLRVVASYPQPIKSAFKEELHTRAMGAMIALGLTIG